MTQEITLAIVGCGGMGTRHMYGMKEYAAVVGAGLADHPPIRLAAVCDPNERNANLLADTAAAELGTRPRVFTKLEELLDQAPEVVALDVATETRFHHEIACTALDGGRHVMVEKPMALTVGACNRMMAAAERAGRLLAVAENYRRDPLVRLTRALLDAGAIGDRWLLVDQSVGSGGAIVITPWRHKRLLGGTLLDVGVHNVDLMLHAFGPVKQVYAQIALFDKHRTKMDRSRGGGRGGGGRGGGQAAIYAQTSVGMPDEVEPDVEDTAVASLRFVGGAIGDWTLSHAGHGQGFNKKTYYGSGGSMEPAPPRTGRGPSVFLDRHRGEPLPKDALLALVPDFAVDEGTARLFGGERLTSYEFEDRMAIDRKIQASVLLDFGRAIATGKPLDVGGVEGRHAVAVVNALFESARLDRPVAVEAVEREDPAVSGWQRELDAEIGLT